MLPGLDRKTFDIKYGGTVFFIAKRHIAQLKTPFKALAPQVGPPGRGILWCLCDRFQSIKRRFYIAPARHGPGQLRKW